MDEIFALGHLEIIATFWSLVRGYGIQVMPDSQDLDQVEKRHPDNW
jgi:type IV secretory pathway TraG/TraD family ATPase VirD4